ncbi:MAG: hypothetical protein AB8B51_20785 [Sedimentitalea sp.]
MDFTLVQIEEVESIRVVPIPTVNLASIDVLQGGVTIRLAADNRVGDPSTHCGKVTGAIHKAGSFMQFLYQIPMTSASDLPDDIDALKARLLAAEAQITEQNATFTERDGIIERKEDRVIRLAKPLADFKRALYGAKSEK